MQNPAESFSKHISWIDHSWKMFHDNVAKKSPVLKCEKSDLDVARSFSGATVIDNLDRRIIIFVDRSGCALSVTQFMKDESEILGHLRR